MRLLTVHPRAWQDGTVDAHRDRGLRAGPALPTGPPGTASVSGTAFTERRWGCRKPGEDAGEHAWGSAQGGCAWDPEGRSGPYVWPSQQELPAGPVWSPGHWLSQHRGA